MSQYIKATLLQVINESQEANTAARVCHHQQQLGPPELHMVLAHIQHQEILAYLSDNKWGEKDNNENESGSGEL